LKILSLKNFQLYGIVSVKELDLILSCWLQVKDKEAQLKASEQKLHDEFERMRKQHTDEKKQLDDKRSQLVSLLIL